MPKSALQQEYALPGWRPRDATGLGIESDMVENLMLSSSVFRISGIVDSRIEDQVPMGATCRFVCNASQPDAEYYCHDELALLGYQIEQLLVQEELTEDSLEETDNILFHNYRRLGFALRFFTPNSN
jgi:hypothetical protein